MRFLTAALMLAATLVFAQSTERYIVETKRVTGGAYTYTNQYRAHNWQLECVAFSLPVNGTNTFAINHYRPHSVVTPYTTEVVTNAFENVETNQWNVSTDTLYGITNQLFTVTTTNDTDSQIYDADDGIPRGFRMQFMDELRFTWSMTNAIQFIYSGN